MDSATGKDDYNSNDGISIIVPVYNGEKYVNNCIKMLLCQKGNYEILIINDGSTDRTDEIIHKYLDNNRIRYYKGPNQGVSAARNKGIHLCNKEWIVFCDVDDEISSGYIQDISETISRHRTSDYLCYARTSLGNEDKTEMEITDPIVNIKMIIAGKGIADASDYLMFAVWSKVFNKDFLIKNSVFFNEDVVFSEDVLFMVSVAVKARNVAYIHRGYYRYVQNSDSICHSIGNNKDYSGFMSYVDAIEGLQSNYFKYWKDEELSDCYCEHMNNCCMVALGRVRTGTRQESLNQRREKIKVIGKILNKYKCRKFDLKRRVKELVIKCFPTFYLVFGDIIK